MTRGREERIKLHANYLNGVAIAVLAIGGVAPVVSVILRPEDNAFSVLAIFGICLLISGALRTFAASLLKELDGDHD